MSEPPLLGHLPSQGADELELLDGFTEFTTAAGLELYDHQENAIMEVLAGNNVILATPTGSGKSLVAAAAHFAAMADGRRSYYTAPIKALVSEKFFALCRDFGSDNVGMITGDASVNPGAPIICCTAEILANKALADGPESDAEMVIADEFHFYGDPQRGWAWQIPLLTLPNAQFLLISATLGPTEFFESDLEQRTGRTTVTIRSDQRPVPLEFDYRRTTLHASVEELLDLDRAPIYVVYFTQKDATEAAQSYLSLNPLSKQEKADVGAAIGGFRFDTPIGSDLRRYLMGGVGVHHAGLLPKYRLLVEKLAQQGLLKIICGTDTLGVGVNVPIRTVLFTQLFKYDGTKVRVLRNREFAQIAGRAGRRGFDTRGFVWAQAPEHVVENLKNEAKAASDPKKKKKVVKAKAPDRGYAHWDEATFWRLVNGEPESVRSYFDINHQMVMTLLDRPGDGCGAVVDLLTDNHETRARQRGHIRQTIAIYRSLIEAGLVEFCDPPDEQGRKVRVAIDLSDEFALNQPLSLWALDALDQLDRNEPAHHLDALTVIESILESPGVIIAAQVNRAKTEAMAEMKADGLEYDERMARLDEITHPMPLREWLYASFDAFRDAHPWVAPNNVRPKSIAREMYEGAFTFKEYVNTYGLKRSEGVVLRYLSDAYRAARQTVTDEVRTDELDDLIEWLGELVRSVDSSLIDEWERLTSPEGPQPVDVRPDTDVGAYDPTSNPRALRVMVRNQAFNWVQLLARERYDDLAHWSDTLSGDELAAAFGPYWDDHDEVLVDAEARGPDHVSWDGERVTQVVSDPAGYREWVVEGHLDLDASRAEERVVLVLDNVRRR